jgi:serine/threonine protein kinase/Flp pilus assembly protein TadD
MSVQRQQKLSSNEVEAAFADLVAEITDKWQAGSPVDVEAYIVRHPEWAERLRNLLPALAVMAEISASGGETERNDGEPIRGTLGDFRIVREVGRGGMGVVYEAEQISLGRRVALKVLPFAATMDPRHLQRFQNEARAAAGLHHTNIVPVYSVGSERGVHYYAMQYIEGRDLASVIAQLREQPRGPQPDPRLVQTVDAADAQPVAPYGPAAVDSRPIAGLSTEGSARSLGYFRSVARLGIQAAEALDHAHQMGIVHRDVKPANLLVDAAGRLWVTDFGLAHIQSDERLTMTGDLVGTLRYMSPEQALAKRVVVDHRTDIYSLGATLYELLTLEPAFGGRDRQELLRQIAFDEPRPPRRWNRAISQELETIVLKAMERNPAERYTTAQELADDLRWFLEDKPIRAKPPTWRQRLVKWSRRHKSVVASAVALLFLALIGSLVSTGLITSAYNAEAKQREKTEDALADVTRQKQKTDDALAEATKQQRRADNNFRQAIEEISQLVKAGEDAPSLEEVRKTQTDRSLAFYQRLLQENRTDPAGRLQAALVHRQLLRHYTWRGEAAKAVEAYGQAVALIKQLTVEFPTEASYQQELGRTHTDMQTYIGACVGAFLFRELEGGRYQRAVEFCRQAVTMSEGLIREQPDEPVPQFLQAFALYKLGYLLWAAGNTKEAEESYSNALRAIEKVAGHPRFNAALAWQQEALVYAWRGKLRAECGRFAEAESDCDKALALLEKLPKTFHYLKVEPFAFAQEALGNVLWATDRHEEAAAAFRRAEETWQEILRSPKGKDLAPFSVMAWFYATCPDKQFRNPAKAVELAKEAVEKVGQSISHSPRDEGDCWKTLGVAQYREGDWKAAVEALEKAMQFRNRGDGTDWFFLAMARWQLGDKDKARTWYDKAVQWMDKNKPKDPDLLRFRAEATELLKIDDLQKQKPE